MFSKLFEGRDKKVSLLVKLGDCLGRSLRENVILFSVDSLNDSVTYLTESDKLISGKFKIDKNVVLEGISIRDSSVFEDPEHYENFISESIHSFVGSLYNNNYKEADQNFDSILGLWENRLKFNDVKAKLHSKAERIKTNTAIVGLDEFTRAVEVSPQIVKFLKENKDQITTVPEIKNAVVLSNTVANAFNFPKLTHDNLVEGKKYILKDGVSDSIYEMICRQELVKKELLESRKEFSTVWATSPAIRNLAGCVFDDDEKIVNALSEAIKEVPYLALTSKSSLFEVFRACLDQNPTVTENELRKYASKIFEFKKPVREELTKALNEQYGINIQNLKEPPSFKSLVNTQIVIFETLSRLAPNGSVVKKTLAELAERLSGKSGVESVDVNSFIDALFTEAGYTFVVEGDKKENKYSKVDLSRIQGELDDIKGTIKVMKGKIAADEETGADKEPEEKAEKAPAPEEKQEETPPKTEVPSDEEGTAPTGEDAEGEEQMDAEAEAPGDKSDLMLDLSDLEDMIDDLTSELGFDEGEDEDEVKLDDKGKSKKEKQASEDDDVEEED